MRHVARLVLAGSALLVACGGAASAPVSATVPAATPSAPVALTGRGASAALAKAWPLDEAPVAVYADLGGLRKTDLFSGLPAAILVLLGTELKPAERACLEGVFAEVQEVAFGGDRKRNFALARFAPGTRAVAACMATSRGAAPVTIAGAAQAWSLADETMVAVTAAGVVAWGERPLVERSLAGRGPGTSLTALRLGPDEYVTWTFRHPVGIGSQGTLVASKERFRVAGDIDFPSEVLAQRVEAEVAAKNQVVTRAGAMGLKPEALQGLTRLLDAFALKRDGKRAHVAFDLHEPPDAQARDLGVAASLGVFAVRKYLTRLKQAEARLTVSHLARAVVSTWELEDGKPRAQKKLASYPAVPTTVPKGARVQTSAADWQAWAPLHFEMSAPQFYQYEIKAAKDGQSAEIIARGDLNGDGKTSQFTGLVRIEGKDRTGVVSEVIHETDPDE